MTPSHYIDAVARFQADIANRLQEDAGGASSLIPTCVLGALTFSEDCQVSFGQWQRLAGKHWKLVGSYGLPGKNFRYVIAARHEDVRKSLTKLAGSPYYQSFINYTSGVAEVRLLSPSDKLPTKEYTADLGRAELHFFTIDDNEKVHPELPECFSAWLTRLGLEQEVKFRMGGYTSIRATPADYEKIAEFNHLRTIRPAAKLSLRSTVAA